MRSPRLFLGALGLAAFASLSAHHVSADVSPWDSYLSQSAPALGYSSAFVDDGAPPGAQFPWMPDTGEYFLSSNIQAVDTRNLGYSKVDWSRWDSYTPQIALYAPQSDYSAAAAVPGVSQSIIDGYRGVVANTLDQQFYQTGYSYFRAFGMSNFDIYANLINSNDFNTENMLNNASYAINQAMNIWRNSEKAAGRNTDNEALPDPKSWNTVPDVVNWVQKYLGAELGAQLLTHKTIPRDAPWGPYDQFGLFANQDSLGSGVSASAVVFQVAPLGLLFSHYVHLFDVAFLRRARVAFMASYTALYQALLVGGLGPYISTAQWLTRLAGASTHVNMILQTEKYLKAKGAWVEATDGIAATDINNGLWTNADALAYLNKLVDILVDTTTKYGITEYNSMYYGNDYESLQIALLHAPNQQIYDKFELVFRMLWWDMAANYHPGSGIFSGAMGRSYDLWGGAHGGLDRMPVRLYVLPLFKQYCSITNPSGVAFSACMANTVGAQPPSDDWALSPVQFMWAAWNNAGYGYVPLDVLTSITINMPYRTVEQRFDQVVGQERMNFITPGYSMAHAGEQTGFTVAAVTAVARIAGEPNRAYPVSSQGGQTHSVQVVRLMLENMDAPFSYQGTSVPGLDLNLIPRQVVSQYQSFMLITSLAAPGKRLYYLGDDDGSTPLATTLSLPLHVDALYADDVPLPRTIGSAYVLPKNTILTVRHGGQSIVVRLLYAERSASSPIQDATSIGAYTGDPAAIATGAGKLPYSFMWIVDSQSSLQGMGRIAVVHRHGNGVDKSSVGPWRLSWLWGAGETTTDTEMKALQTVMRAATFSNTVTAIPVAQQRVDPMGLKNPQWSWSSSVTIDGSATLSVDRMDTLQTWGNDPIWAVQGGLGLYPWYTTFSRKANGKEILQFATGDKANRVSDNSGNLYQPHRDYLKRIASGGSATPATTTTTPTTTTPTTTTPTTTTPTTTTPTTTTPTTTVVASSTGSAGTSATKPSTTPTTSATTPISSTGSAGTSTTTPTSTTPTSTTPTTTTPTTTTPTSTTPTTTTPTTTTPTTTTPTTTTPTTTTPTTTPTTTTTPPTGGVCSGTCAIWQGYDFNGGDIGNAPVSANAGATDCCALCGKTSGCKSWTVYEAICYMKNVYPVPIQRSSWNIVSGITGASGCTTSTTQQPTVASSTGSAGTTTTTPTTTPTTSTSGTTNIVNPTTPSSNTPVATDPTKATQATTPTVVTSGTTPITVKQTFVVPGRVESELFSNWYDTTIENLGRAVPPNRGLYATSPVDISYSTAASYGYYITYVHDMEWLEYPLAVSKLSKFQIAVRYAQIAPVSKPIQFYIDGVLQCTVNSQNTNGWENFAMGYCNTTSVITPGAHTLRVQTPQREINLDYSHLTFLTTSASGFNEQLGQAVPEAGASTSMPSTSTGINFQALKASVHMAFPVNMTQNDAFVARFTSQAAQLLGFGADSGKRIMIVDIKPDGTTDSSSTSTDSSNSNNGQTSADSTGTTVQDNGSSASVNSNTNSGSADTSSAADGGVASSTAAATPTMDSTGNSDANSGSNQTYISNTAATGTFVPTTDASASSGPASRRLLQAASLFDLTLPRASNGVTVTFFVLPSTLPTVGGTAASGTPDQTTITAALAAICTGAWIASSSSAANALPFDCNIPPTATPAQVELCVDGGVAESCPLKVTFTDDPDATALTPSPFGNVTPMDGPNGRRGSQDSSRFNDASAKIWVLAGVAAFVCFLAGAVVVYYARKWWYYKGGKERFLNNRRRASFDVASDEMQMAGMDAGLVKYRSAYPTAPEQGKRREYSGK